MAETNAIPSPVPLANPAKPSLHAVAASERLIAIDALRGFDLFWIIGGGPMASAFCKLFANPLPPWLDRQFEHVP